MIDFHWPLPVYNEKIISSIVEIFWLDAKSRKQNKRDLELCSEPEINMRSFTGFLVNSSICGNDTNERRETVANLVTHAVTRSNYLPITYHVNHTDEIPLTSSNWN